MSLLRGTVCHGSEENKNKHLRKFHNFCPNFYEIFKYFGLIENAYDKKIQCMNLKQC